MATIAVHRGDQIEPGRAGVAGLEAIGAGKAPEQTIVVAVGAAAVDKPALSEQVEVLREVIEQVHRQANHVVRGGALVRIGQARGVAELGRCHAERMGTRGHASGKRMLRPGQMLGDGRGNIVGRLHNQGADGITDRDRFAGLEAQLGWRLRGSMARDRDRRRPTDLLLLERLKHHIDRHEFGEGGWVDGQPRLLLMKNAAGMDINDHRSGARGGGRREGSGAEHGGRA